MKKDELLKSYNNEGYVCLLMPKKVWASGMKLLENYRLADTLFSGVTEPGIITELTISKDAVCINIFHDDNKKCSVMCGWNGGTYVDDPTKYLNSISGES